MTKITCKVNEVTKIAFGRVPRCQKCNAEIPKGSIRFGFASVSANGKEGWTAWWHLTCTGKEQMDHIKDIGGIEKVEGWEGLTAAQQVAVRSGQQLVGADATRPLDAEAAVIDPTHERPEREKVEGCDGLTAAQQLNARSGQQSVDADDTRSCDADEALSDRAHKRSEQTQDLFPPGKRVRLSRFAYFEEGEKGVHAGALGVVKEWVHSIQRGPSIRVAFGAEGTVKVKLKGGGKEDQVSTFFTPLESICKSNISYKVNAVTKISFGKIPRCCKCRDEIAKGSLRFGFAPISGSGKEGWTSWWHVACAGKKEMEQLKANGGIEASDGWGTLTGAQQTQLRVAYTDAINHDLTGSSNQGKACELGSAHIDKENVGNADLSTALIQNAVP